MHNQPTNYPTAPIAPHGNNVEAYRLYVKSYALYVEACKQIHLSKRPFLEHANPLAHRCTICMHFFASRNMLFRHLKDTHFNKNTKTENQTPCKRTGRKERIRKLESQIQLARINSTAVDMKPGKSSAYVQKRPELAKTVPSDAVRKINTLPEPKPGYKPTEVTDHYDIPAFGPKPGKNSDLDFEFLDLPGYTTTNYVECPNGTLAVEESETTQISQRVLDKFGDTYDYAERVREIRSPAKVSFRFSDVLTNAGPKKFEEVLPGTYTRDAFRSTNYPQEPQRFYEASSLRATAPSFTPSPSAFADTNFEFGHGRRESIFSRVGDDELFDSE